jgi:hypothetical protein
MSHSEVTLFFRTRSNEQEQQQLANPKSNSIRFAIEVGSFQAEAEVNAKLYIPTSCCFLP